MRQYWFLAIVPKSLPGSMAFAVLLASTLVALFTGMFGVFSRNGLATELMADLGNSLFFAILIAYAIVAGAYVLRRSSRAMLELRPALNCDDDTFAEMLESIEKTPTSTALGFALIGLAGGTIHNAVIWTTFESNAVTWARWGGIIGTILTWFVVTYLVTAFIRNAQMFARLGADHVRVDLFKPQALYPFGLLAVLPTLGLVGTQALYPLLSLEGGFNAIGTIPGFTITMASLTYLFFRTTWPLHKRIAAAKNNAVLEVQAQIDDLRSREAGLVQLQALLAHREYLERLSEWPFKISTLARWSLYLLIPPLTWVGAAFIEKAVDAFLA